jgi:hypothetical protein
MNHQHTPEEFEAKAKAQIRQWWRYSPTDLRVQAFELTSYNSQVSILEGLRQAGYIDRSEDILSCGNQKERSALYRKSLTKISL